MGGGTGTGGSQYKSMTLEQPWGDSVETVRVFPPCEVKYSWNSSMRGGGSSVVVFTKRPQGTVWKRKTVGIADFFPDEFIAWDDKNNEYAWHVVGSIDVPSARDPDLFKIIIRGETESVTGGAGKPRTAKRKRRTLREWFLGHSSANEPPDFLRKGAK